MNFDENTIINGKRSRKTISFFVIIMGVENEPLSLEDIFWNYSMEENICQDINGVRFTKVLQKTLEKKLDFDI